MENQDFTLLYVDDEPHNLTTFKATFRRKYRILSAESGREGLELMRKHNVGLVISDQRMPEMTGVEFLEQVAREFPDAIRIILTGFSDVEAIITAINNGGIFRYITKPWSENELQMTIENARQLYNLQLSNQKLVRQLQLKVEEQEKTLRVFSQFVPEPVVQKSLQESENSIFQGEVAKVVVLFCDIRGFTRMSENLPPKTIVGMLNHYYALMTESVKRHHGSVCQFVGDEVFAVFGAPVSDPNNEQNAVFCAIEMVDKLRVINEKYQDVLREEIIVGIGLHSGEAITGNVGSSDIIRYAVNGSIVNVGRRIEERSKEEPNVILASEVVFEKVKDLVKGELWNTMELRSGPPALNLYKITRKKEQQKA